MLLLVRIILVLSLLAQSAPGLVMQRCVGMPGPKALAAAGLPEDARCGCCNPGRGDGAEASADGKSIECPMSAQGVGGYAGCNCKDPRPDEPKTPAPKSQTPVEVQFAFAPVLIAVLPAEPMSAAMRRRGEEPLLRRSAPSFQSLLCVWLM